jgi:hypothetical protein
MFLEMKYSVQQFNGIFIPALECTGWQHAAGMFSYSVKSLALMKRRMGYVQYDSRFVERLPGDA